MRKLDFDPALLERYDARLDNVVSSASRLERLYSGATWSEGPAWIAEDQSVLWSDIPNNRMLRWSSADGMTVWREGVEYTNGHAREADGALLHCSHGLRAIVRTRSLAQPQADDEIVVDRYDGRRLNSPNDVVVKSDGTIWFTDPPYGILSDAEGHKAPREQEANHVFCFDPATGELCAVTAAVEEPNGLAFSPDESILYVSDTSAALRKGGNHHIVMFDVERGPAGYKLSDRRLFAVVEPGLPDGFRVDRQGWIFTSALDGVHIYHSDGSLLGKIPVPEKVGNLTFGGPDGNELFICASTSLYRIVLNTRGA